jgi:hypothetical protein
VADTPPPVATVINAPWHNLSIEDMGNGAIDIAQAGRTGVTNIVVARSSIPGLIVALQEVARG